MQAILAAALEELQTIGYEKLTMEGVATAAGTGKAALYRRWSSKDELVAEALRQTLPAPDNIQFTGAVRDDLLALLHYLRDAAATTNGAAFQSVKAQAGPALHHYVVQRQVIDPAKQLIRDVIADGASRGEVRPEAVSEPVASVGPAMLIYYALTHGTDVPDEYLASIVDDVIVPILRP